MPKKGIQRNYHLHIRLSDFEQEELENIALETGQTLSDFVRIAILEKKERVRIYNENKNKKDNSTS
jgi:predicted DNA-binding protein